MSQGLHADRDRSFALAQRAQELMRDYGPSATPRAYAVWYTYVSGEQPLLNDAVKRLITQNRALTEDDTTELHEQYLGGERLIAAAGETSTTLLSEIEGIVEILNLSVGSATQYGESLRVFSEDLSRSTLTGETRLHDIVATLVAATREVATNNRVLEARMRESRSEIETLREKLEETRIQSLTDALTGLSNRKHFEEMLGKAIDVSAHQRVPSSLIVLDIDFFKRFNDLYGHLTGDQVLRLVGIVMREAVDKNATLARFGGEEFSVVLPGKDRAAARAIAEKIRLGVMGRELIKRSSGESLGKVTVSVGLATYRAGDTAISMLERADLCMFAAKRAGRNRTVDDSVPAEILQNVA